MNRTSGAARVPRGEYATTEEATTARQQLDNIKWPKFNSSVLRVEYAGEDDFNRFKKMKEENNVSNVRNVNGNGQPSDIQVIRQRQVREITTTNDKENDVRQIGRSPKREDQADNKLWPTNREWDRGKGEWKLGERSPPTTNTDRRERSSRRESPSSKRAEIKEKAAPAKLLEDLFRKTKTSPFIYWLPLTQEQMVILNKKRSNNSFLTLQAIDRRFGASLGSSAGNFGASIDVNAPTLPDRFVTLRRAVQTIVDARRDEGVRCHAFVQYLHDIFISNEPQKLLLFFEWTPLIERSTTIVVGSIESLKKGVGDFVPNPASCIVIVHGSA
uniref:Uncharacterized protein n=1 Tax=Romanomermis culicivorax TaxID=13658 RepID=A0A915I4L8_ROMCU